MITILLGLWLLYHKQGRTRFILTVSKSNLKIYFIRTLTETKTANHNE